MPRSLTVFRVCDQAAWAGSIAATTTPRMRDARFMDKPFARPTLLMAMPRPPLRTMTGYDVTIIVRSDERIKDPGEAEISFATCPPSKAKPLADAALHRNYRCPSQNDWADRSRGRRWGFGSSLVVRGAGF